MEVLLFSILLQDPRLQQERFLYKMLELGLYTQALTYGCGHTRNTLWKESAFYANFSLVKGLLFLHTTIWAYLPHKPGLQF